MQGRLVERLPRRRRDKEWDAIKAAERLKVEWSEVAPLFPNQMALYDHIRKAPARNAQIDKQNGNVDEAFRARRARSRRIRMAVPVARLHGPAGALGRDADGKVDQLERLAEARFRAARLAAMLDLLVEN